MSAALAECAADQKEESPEPRCPQCDYNLRGLDRPRCPECGFEFDWQDTGQPRFRRHPFLIEEHEGAWIRRFAATYWASLRPRRFWASVERERPIRAWRVGQFWATCVLVCVGLGILGCTIRNTWIAESAVVSQGVAPILSLSQIITPPSHFQMLAIVGMPLLWPCLTCVSILAFRGSMKCADVRFLEVIRCVAYTVPTLATTWLAVLGISLFFPMLAACFWLDIVVIIIWCWQLRIALELHLGIRHALRLVTAAHLILAFSIFTSIVYGAASQL